MEVTGRVRVRFTGRVSDQGENGFYENKEGVG